MKLKLMMTGLLGLMSVAAFAQKGELNNAKDKYEKFTVEQQSKFTLAQANTDIQDAKTSIDKASVNDKTASLPLTYALKGAIYSSLAVRDTVPATSLPNFKIADDALAKAKSLDSAKQENKAMIHAAYLNLAQYKFDEGRAEYSGKKYDLAYQSFGYYNNIVQDTTSTWVTGLAAANQGDKDPKYYKYAIDNYSKLVKTNYSKNPGIYMDMSSIYLSMKDTADAFRITDEGVTKFPGNNELREREIQIGLQTGKQDQLVSKIQDAITANPNKKELYYYDGLTYSQISDAFATKAKATKNNPTEKARLRQLRADNDAKAADALKKAVAIDPSYYDATLTLGYVLLNPGLDEYNAANQLPTNQQKEFEAGMAKAKADLEIAKPYLLKAVDLNPKSVDALTNLKAYYLVEQDMVNANKIQKQIEALGGN